jgi:hypothetical protein
LESLPEAAYRFIPKLITEWEVSTRSSFCLLPDLHLVVGLPLAIEAAVVSLGVKAGVFPLKHTAEYPAVEALTGGVKKCLIGRAEF